MGRNRRAEAHSCCLLWLIKPCFCCFNNNENVISMNDRLQRMIGELELWWQRLTQPWRNIGSRTSNSQSIHLQNQIRDGPLDTWGGWGGGEGVGMNFRLFLLFHEGMTEALYTHMQSYKRRNEEIISTWGSFNFSVVEWLRVCKRVV